MHINYVALGPCLCLDFPIYTMGIITVLTSWGSLEDQMGIKSTEKRAYPIKCLLSLCKNWMRFC